MQLSKIAMNPWDFTLYSSEDGLLVMKVIFSEGCYKVDVGRYFLIAGSEHPTDNAMEALKILAHEIRDAYPETGYPEMKGTDLTIVK